MRKDMLSKALVMGIFVLLFGAGVVSGFNIQIKDTEKSVRGNILYVGGSVVSSTDNFLKAIPADCSPLKSVYSSEEKSIINTVWYEFISAGPEGTGFYAFYPNGTYRFGKWEGDDFFSGGTWTNDGRYLCCMYENGTLYDINPETFDACAIGDGGASLNGLAYNPVTEKLYGASSSDLYEIDITTGEQTHVGAFGIGTSMIAIAFDIDGICYGWDVKFSGESYLFKINIYTGEATIVGGMGINLCFAQDGCFEYGTDILYLVAYSATGMLLECDEDTGECIFHGNFQWEATAYAISYELDNEPPVTTHTLDPPEPDGLNGWYVSNVSVTLNATDDISGVKEIRYRIDGGAIQIIPGDNGSFILHEDGNDILVEYWAIDNAGNVETPKNVFTIDIDQTEPYIDLAYEIIGDNRWQGWEIIFIAIATDAMTNIDRIEFYLNDLLIETVYGPELTLIYFPINGSDIVKIIAYDIAGNYAEIIINGSDIKACFRSNFINQNSNNVWFLRFLERFPLIERFLNSI